MTYIFSIAQIFSTDQSCINCAVDVSTGVATQYRNFIHTLLCDFSLALMLLCLVFYIWLDKILSNYSLYDTIFQVMFRSEDSETRQNSNNVQLHATLMNLEYCLSISSGISLANSSHTIVMKSAIITPSMKLRNLYDIAWHACWEHEQRFGEVSLSDFVHTF